MVKMYLIMGIGGFLGTISRYLCQLAVIKYNPHPFPFGTLLVNITGCFFIGLFYEFFNKQNTLSEEWRIFLTTGFCGGFTTFSTFSFENITFIKQGLLLEAGIYIGASVFGSLFTTYIGITIIKLV